MLRLELDALEVLNEKFYYGGGLFSGVAFETSRGHVTGAWEVRHGLKAEEYRNQYLEEVPEGPHIRADIEGFEGDPEYEICTFAGKPFEGVLYDFEGIFCTGESMYLNGAPTVDVGWHRNGALRAYDEFYSGVGGTFEWFDDGRPQRLQVVKAQGVSLGAEFSEVGGLAVLEIAGDFFGAASEVVDRLPFEPIGELSDLTNYGIAPNLLVARAGVGPEVFEALAKDSGMERVKVFRSFATSLGAPQIARLLELPGVERIEFDDQSGELAGVLRDAKRRRPEVLVLYNDTELR